MTSETSAGPAALVERRGNVLVITLNRPEARNAVNGAVSTAVVMGLRAKATAIAEPSSTRSVAVAARARPRNGSCLTSLSQKPSTPSSTQ